MKSNFGFHWRHVLLVIVFAAQEAACASTSAPTAQVRMYANIHPTNSEEQLEGDRISLLCRVFNVDMDMHIISWTRRTPNLLFIASSKDMEADGEGNAISYNRGTTSAVLNLTISQVSQSDAGTYRCDLSERVADNNTTLKSMQRTDLTLEVYPVQAFPVCSPSGESEVDFDTELRCQTTGNAIPEITDGDGRWVRQIGQLGQKLTKNAAPSDSGRTFTCIANLATSPKNLSCTIGPLTVSGKEGATSPLNPTSNSKDPTTAPTPSGEPPSLSLLIGVALAAIVLLILIILVINLLCCRFDLGRCQRLLGVCTCASADQPHGPKGGLNNQRSLHIYEKRIGNPMYDVPGSGVNSIQNIRRENLS